jgi:hypothetical protein
MPDQKTVPEKRNPVTDILSRAQTRVISRGSAKSAGLEPRMVLARRTIGAFVLDHQGTPIKFEHDFEIAGSGRLKTREVRIGSLTDDNGHGMQTFTVGFEYRGWDPLSRLCASTTAYHKLRKLLFDHGMTFKSATGATVNKVTIEAVVPAALTVSANLRCGQIAIALRNVLMLGTTKYQLAGDRLDRAFIESLIGIISGQSNAFYALAAATPRSIRN